MIWRKRKQGRATGRSRLYFKPHWEASTWVKTWRRWGRELVTIRRLFLVEKQRVHMPEAGGCRELQELQGGQCGWKRMRWWGGQGRKGWGSEGGSYTAWEVITGVLQDSCIQLFNVHSSTQASELRLKSSLWIPLARHPGLGLLLSRPRDACISFTSGCRGSQLRPKPLTSTSSEKGRHWRIFSRGRCTHGHFIALSTLAYTVLDWLYLYFILKK